MTKQVLIRIDDDLYQELRTVSFFAATSMTDIVRRAIRKELDRMERKEQDANK